MAEQNQIDDQSVYAVGHKMIRDVHSLARARLVRVSVNKIGGKSLGPMMFQVGKGSGHAEHQKRECREQTIHEG